MTHISKTVSVGVISFFLVLGLSIPATTYAWIGDMNYSNMGNIYASYPMQTSNYGSSYSYPQNNSMYGKPREQLFAHSYSPMSQQMQPSYYSYQPNYSYSAPYSQGYSYGQNSYSMPYNYSYGQYQQYQMPQNYSYGYSSYNSYSQPYFGYYPQPTGNTDFFGNDLCNWGDYSGYPCDQDPHQWVYDYYTGTWY